MNPLILGLIKKHNIAIDELHIQEFPAYLRPDKNIAFTFIVSPMNYGTFIALYD